MRPITPDETAAAALDGHIRVGFENNLYLSDRPPAPDDAALVAQARVGAARAGREPADARQLFMGLVE